MRKSGSAVLLLLGYANSVDAMARVRRGSMNFFDDLWNIDADTAEDATAATTTTADPFDDSFFNESDDDTFGASAIINVEADVQVEAEADVQVETDGQVKIGGRAIGGSLGHISNNIFDRPTVNPTTHAAQTTQQPTTRTVHTHAHPHTAQTHSPYTCDNGGSWNHSLQRCDCPTGFAGIWCNQVATCPTCYRGTCQVTNGVAKCVCEAGWSLSDCRSHNCNGHGYSEIVNGQATCNCHQDWTGDVCQTYVKVGDITECKNGHPYNGICHCFPNWQGSKCDQQIPQRTCSRNCGNGQCYMGTTSSNDYCVCNPGFSGSNCNTEVCTGRCDGKLCRIINDKAVCYTYTPPTCSSTSCPVNQHCRMVGSLPTCECNAGYSGSSCNISTSCNTKPCGANMHCRMHDNTPECHCNTGYYMSGTTCLKYNPITCASTLCAGKRYCIMDGHTPRCVCQNGWTGDHCNIRVCNKQCVNGSCAWFNDEQKCVCNSGFIGETCAQREPQTCNKVCAHGGICKFNSNGQQFCDCPVGWTADDCTVSTICDLSCQNGGQCEFNFGNKYCKCPDGWKGKYCNQRVNTCNKNCGSHGTCIGSGSNSACSCKDNYTGEYCNIKPCPDACNGRGTCTLGQCSCNNGWSGAACQNRDCTLNCGANGSCKFTGNGGQFCDCDLGYQGPSCTKITCDLNCNNGRCVFNDDYTQKCACNNGYSGAVCDISDITPCNLDGRGASPCKNSCQCSLKTPAQCDDCEYTCTNTNGNSFLGGQCQYNEPSLTCMTESIRIQVDRALIDEWEQNTLSAEWGATLFNGANYDARKCQFSRSIAGGDYAISISSADWASCGGFVSVQNGMLTVSNKVSRDVDHSVISFEEPVFDWTCQYQISVAEGIVGPPLPRKPIQIIENHNFNIKMNFYCDDREVANRQQLQTLDGNNVIMTDKVFVNIDLNQLNQFQHLPKMGMRLGDCVAEAGYGDQAEKFTIIQNGCPTSLGLTRIEHQSDSEIEFKFTNFVDRRGVRRSTRVKITCQISMCGTNCAPAPAVNQDGVCISRRRRGIPEIDSELELLESDLFEDSEMLNLSETEELSIKNIELYDTVLYMDIEDIIPMQNATKIITEN